MSSIDIYSILSSKPHNSHYLNRYLKLIESFKYQQKVKNKTEYHHICPKSKFLFPEYANLKIYPWNGIHLTYRQHFVAHWLLWKIYHGEQAQAFKLMCAKSNILNIKSSKYYNLVKIECSKMMSLNNPNASGKYSKLNWINSSEERKLKQSKLMSDLNKKYKSKPKEIRYYNCSCCESIIQKTEFVHHEPKQHYYCNSKCKNIFIKRNIKGSYKITHSTRICPYCNKSGKGSNMTRYHFNNCKNK